MENEQSVETFTEGALAKALVNRYERNPKVRAAAIRIHGTRCQGCGFSFSDVFRGWKFIHKIPENRYGNRSSCADQECDSDEQSERIVSQFLLYEPKSRSVEAGER